jgi:hypothetical protein
VQPSKWLSTRRGSGSHLFDHLECDDRDQTYPEGEEYAGYYAEADAHRKLSAACVRWGRGQAAAGKKKLFNTHYDVDRESGN